MQSRAPRSFPSLLHDLAHQPVLRTRWEPTLGGLFQTLNCLDAFATGSLSSIPSTPTWAAVTTSGKWSGLASSSIARRTVRDEHRQRSVRRMAQPRTRADDPRIAIGYLRVSTDAQDLGPEAQRREILT